MNNNEFIRMDGSCSCTVVYTNTCERSARLFCERMARRLPFELVAVQYDRLPVRPDGLENAVIFCELSEEDRVLSCLDLRGRGCGNSISVEGFRINSVVSGRNRRLLVCGSGKRGVLYGAGKLLRFIKFYDEFAVIPYLYFASSPVQPFRGVFITNHRHDMGHRNWSLEQWGDYIDDLALWGVNTIMYLPMQFGQSDVRVWDGEKNIYSDYWEHETAIAEVIKAHDMDVAIYLGLNDVFPQDAAGLRPAKMGEVAFHADSIEQNILIEEACVCPSDSAAEDVILKRRSELFKRLKYLDYVYVPTTDYGGCACEKCAPYLTKTYLPLAEKIAKCLKAVHPEAKFLVSLQLVNRDEVNTMILPALQKADWSDYICLGSSADSGVLPTVLSGLPTDRQKVLLYPEITMLDNWGQYGFTSFIRNFNYHNGYGLYCEDMVFGNLPPGQENISGFYGPRSACGGFDFGTEWGALTGVYTYSEGRHDDLTKVVWLSKGWAPLCGEYETAFEYSRLHFGEKAADTMLRLFKALEERSVRRCYYLKVLKNWYVPINAYWGDGFEDSVKEIIRLYGEALPLLPAWAKNDWRIKLIEFRVKTEELGLLIEQDATDRIEAVSRDLIGLAEELYKNYKIITLSRMSPFDTPEDYIKVPVWDERANKKVLDSLIISCRTFAEERREGIEREYFDDSIYDAYH